MNNLRLAVLSVLVVLSSAAPGLRAAEHLPYKNEATRQLLLQSLKHEDRVFRVRAGTGLASAQDPRNAGPVSALEKDPVRAVQKTAAFQPQGYTNAVFDSAAEQRAASAAGFEARPVVSDSLVTETHRDPRVRLKARLQRLASDPATQPDFSTLVGDADYFVRRAVSAQAVADRGTAALPIWRKLAASARVEDHVEASWAIGQLASKADEPLLIPLLLAPNERLRIITAGSLQRMGGDPSRVALSNAITHFNNPTNKTLPALLKSVNVLLARPALPVLRALAGDDKASEESRTLALEGIRLMADREALPVLRKNIVDYNSPHAAMREFSARALGLLGGPEDLKALVKLTTERVIPVPGMPPTYDAEETRIACVLAIQQLKGNDQIKAIAKHSSTEDSGEDFRRSLAGVMTMVTGQKHEFRKSVFFRDYFVVHLGELEYPPDLAANLKMPAVFPVP